MLWQISYCQPYGCRNRRAIGRTRYHCQFQWPIISYEAVSSVFQFGPTETAPSFVVNTIQYVTPFRHTRYNPQVAFQENTNQNWQGSPLFQPHGTIVPFASQTSCASHARVEYDDKPLDVLSPDPGRSKIRLRKCMVLPCAST